MDSARINDAAIANVFVNATGVNNFPSGPVKVNTGRKARIVVEAEVMTAPPTSLEAS